jgi:hypothetical protein
MALGLMSLPDVPAFAADKKPLKEILYDKGNLTTDEAASVQETKLSKWVERVTLSGDLRLRQESFMKDPALDRHRQRFRLRIAADTKIEDFIVGIKLATGTGEQVSTNQSFDNLSGQKAVWIDRAFLSWQGSETKWLKLTGGRMPNPFFTVYTTDAVWDDDFNPEGFAENFKFKMGESLSLFLNAGQIVLDEDSGDNNDQWMFGEQVGVNMEPMKDVKTTLAVAYYDFTNTNKGGFGQNVCNRGNTRSQSACPSSTTSTANLTTGAVTTTTTEARLINDYNVLDVTAQIGMKAGTLPVSLMGDYVKNMADPKTAAGVETGDTGYQLGLILGKASDPKTWEVAYFYKVMETDATIADVSDSDFGDGGLDRRGHIIWGAYNFTKYLQLKTKFFNTKRESETGDPSTKDDIDRLQVDLVMKF